MNELQLSDDLTTIETEIKSYQNIAGQSIFEIGRRLKHVKENDLVHGEFGEWLDKLNMDKRMAQQMMKISSNPELNASTYTHLGTRALYEIATLPESERTIEHTTSNGETKTPDEMTVKELRELKKELKDKEEQSKSLYKQINVANRKIEELENAEPEVVEKYMEPEDYQEIKESNKQLKSYLDEVSNHNKKLNSDIEKLRSERSETDEKSQKYDELNKAINSMNTKLNEGQQRLKAQKEIYDLVKGSEKVIREVAPLCYLAFSRDIVDNDYARKPIEKIITDLTDMAQRLQKQINQGDVIDV